MKRFLKIAPPVVDWSTTARKHLFHGGESKGFRNNTQLFPEQKPMVIILTNRNEGEPANHSKKIEDIFLPKE